MRGGVTWAIGNRGMSSEQHRYGWKLFWELSHTWIVASGINREEDGSKMRELSKVKARKPLGTMTRRPKRMDEKMVS